MTQDKKTPDGTKEQQQEPQELTPEMRAKMEIEPYDHDNKDEDVGILKFEGLPLSDREQALFHSGAALCMSALARRLQGLPPQVVALTLRDIVLAIPQPAGGADVTWIQRINAFLHDGVVRMNAGLKEIARKQKNQPKIITAQPGDVEMEAARRRSSMKIIEPS
jgi:hypothetical protein